LAPQFLHCKCVQNKPMCIGLLEFLLPFFFSSHQHYCFIWHSPRFPFPPFFKYIDLSLLSRCCCIYHFIHGRKKFSLDGNRDKEKGTTTITTYMTFLFCLVQIRIYISQSSSFLESYFSSYLISTIDIDEKEAG
jgi:hypothetical protein